MAVLVRPEDVVFAEPDGADARPAIVLSTSFLGSLRRTRVRLDGALELTVQHDVGHHPVAGDAVYVRLTGQPVAVSRA